MLPLAWLPALAAPNLDEPLRTGASAPADAAVVVGIEDYAFVPDVPYARRDAALFHDLLVYTRGVPADRVTLLADASREQIRRALDEARGQVGPGGTLWVYFAGHGAASATDGSRLVLGVDVMADPAVFGERGLGVDELQPDVQGASTVVVLDTCYAGVGRAGAEIVAGKRFAVPAWASEEKPGVAVWSAASANELAGPLDGVRHGAFTWLLTGAMRGWADGELDGHRDGAVTLAEADAWVSRALRATPLRQQPELVAEGSTRDQVLATGVAEPPPTLDPEMWEPAGTAEPEPEPEPEDDDACPWSGAIEVGRDGLETVLINGESWFVAGKIARNAFEQTLLACGYDSAAESFRKWRAARRTTNSVWYPLVLPSVIPAAAARNRRKAFEQALEEGR